MRQDVLRVGDDGEEVMLCGADVEVAFINHGGGAKRFPDDLRTKLLILPKDLALAMNHEG